MLELRRGNLLKKVVEAIKDFVDAANFDFSATGLRLQTMDSNRAAMVELLLPQERFHYYRCDREISIGVNLEKMSDLLECAGDDDVITLKVEDDDRNYLTIVFENPARDMVTTSKMKLVDIPGEHNTLPEIEYHATVEMSSLKFRKICRDLDNVGIKVVIAVTKEGVTFSTSGGLGTKTVLCKQNFAVDKLEDVTEIQMKKTVSLTFPLSYLCKFTEATPLSNTVTLSFCTELPLMVEYKIAKTGYIRFHLAPIV
ncbi:hypothetical protein ABFS82_06G122900 [Erythranthe guttata]|uniref:DNA sliding clamp PCNA n=1 Tax=Erythranthe guttata TaxID=4155 RepID=A0A022R5B6_ERYGU|nr:hypothetical protein MIMGU_mgv1a012322mg [Erythranthe guttata]